VLVPKRDPSDADTNTAARAVHTASQTKFISAERKGALKECSNQTNALVAFAAFTGAQRRRAVWWEGEIRERVVRKEAGG